MAPSGPSITNLKRKQPSSHTSTLSSQNNPKRVKTFSARNIISQSTDKALNKNGELDVASFVKAREYEIRALGASMDTSKRTRRTRAFQQVPRELRRRTASHNVKKVPKRLRARTTKEMKDDNTPTVTPRSRNSTARKRLQVQQAKKLQGIAAAARAKNEATKAGAARGPGSAPGNAETSHSGLQSNTLAKLPKPPSKFRKRQVHKAWLPTHLYHSKRAHMTPPKEPLWRFAVAITPTEKSYRATHRAGSMRGCVAWDMSYMSTIGLEGFELSLISLLRSLGVPDRMLIHGEGVRWRQGTRSWNGWLRERDGEQRLIAPAQVVWHTNDDPSNAELHIHGPRRQQKRRLLLRVHPSAYLQLWNNLLKVAKMQRPPVSVEDLRFEIGSLEIEGPGAAEALVGVLHPIREHHKDSSRGDSFATTWSCLAAVSNPASLPANALLEFQFLDPRLHHPPRTIVQPKPPTLNEDLLKILAEWPLDSLTFSSTFFDRTARLTASRLLPSQKSINRRKGDALPGAYPASLPTDPRIPVVLLASRPENGSRGQGSWTLLLPWKCVVPVWYSLMHYPLSTGGNPRFGGLAEKRQLAFEYGIPWFPGDFPGTKAGWEWEMSERARRKSEWEKRPKGRRTEWSSVDLGGERKGEVGLGWACDWERLINGLQEMPTVTCEESAQQPDQVPPHNIHHILRSDLNSIQQEIPPSALATVRITLIHRGVPTACARIYRLPANDKTLHSEWLARATAPAKMSRKNTSEASCKTQFSNAQHHDSRVALAASLTTHTLNQPFPLNTTAQSETAETGCVPIPGEEDLIGFITTGNFNLGKGRGTGIGCIALARMQNETGKVVVKDGLCIIRETGLSIGRIAKWEVI